MGTTRQCVYLTLVLIGIVPAVTYGAPTCAGSLPSGCRCATDRDIAAGLPAGKPVCSADVQATNADASGEAKQYLKSLIQGGRCGPYQTSVEQLNPQFAICAARFLKDATAREPRLRIVSAFRSAQHQAYLCGGGCGQVNGPCAAAGQSKHQQGIALDLTTGTYILPASLKQMARGYGLHFPVRNDSGHMEPVPGANCADPNFRPTDTTTSNMPLGLDNTLRNALQANSFSNTQPLPLTTPVNQAQQQSLNSAFFPVGAPSGSLNFVNTGNGSSVADTLQNLVTGTSTTPTSSTSGGVPVTINTSDVAYLTPPSIPPHTSQQYAPTPGIGSPQTFTSPDLALPPLSQNPNTIQATLNEMRSQLTSVLAYLRPFGRLGAGEVQE